MQEYNELLSNAKWQINDSPGLASVELVRQMESGQQLTVRFDVRNVVEGIEQPFEDEFEGEEEEGSEEKREKESDELDFDQEHIFPIEIELRAVDGKRLILDCEINATSEESPLMVTNATIQDPAIKANVDQGQLQYSGPQYEQLDEGLKESLDAYANKLVHGDLVQFISDYSFSKESTQYGVWLENVKSILKP